VPRLKLEFFKVILKRAGLITKIAPPEAFADPNPERTATRASA
jgi:hypothetical protein